MSFKPYEIFYALDNGDYLSDHNEIIWARDFDEAISKIWDIRVIRKSPVKSDGMGDKVVTVYAEFAPGNEFGYIKVVESSGLETYFNEFPEIEMSNIINKYDKSPKVGEEFVKKIQTTSPPATVSDIYLITKEEGDKKFGRRIGGGVREYTGEEMK